MHVFIGISHIIAGVIIILVCIPLIRGSVKMNTSYGIRFRQSYASEKAWYAINRYGGIQFVIFSALLVLIGILLLCIPVRTGSLAFWLSLFAPLIMLVPAVTAFIFARQFGKTDM